MRVLGIGSALAYGLLVCAAYAADGLREKRYEAARFALKYARKGFDDYGSRAHDPAQKQNAGQMQKDIDVLSEQLRKEDPTTLQKAGDAVKGWGTKVKKWFVHPAPEPGHKPAPQGR